MHESSTLKAELELISDSHNRGFSQVELKIHYKISFFLFFLNNELKLLDASKSCGSDQWLG